MWFLLQLKNELKCYMTRGAIVAAGRVVLDAPYHLEFCVGFSQITVTCLIATVVASTCRLRSSQSSRYSFVSVPSTITLRQAFFVLVESLAAATMVSAFVCDDLALVPMDDGHVRMFINMTRWAVSYGMCMVFRTTI